MRAALIDPTSHRVESIAEIDSGLAAEYATNGAFVVVEDPPVHVAAGSVFDAQANTFTTAPAPAVDILALRAHAIARVNADAGACRAKYITAIPGQETTYQLKSAEVDHYDAVIANEGTPNPLHYPVIASEAQAIGLALDDCMTLIRETRNQWVQLAAYVEGIRRGAIVAIQAALTPAAIRAAIPTEWP